MAVGCVVMVWPAPPAPRSPTVGPAADERVVAGPLDGRTAAWLTVGDAAARVRVRFARLPGLLYRISTASDAGVVPVVSLRDGRVTLRLNESAGDGLDEVRIVLNRSVRWDIRLPAGAGEQQLNLRDGRVQRVEVGAAGLAEVWLPEPDGTVPIVFTGGIGTAVVSVRRGTPVRIHLTQGAGSVETPWIANNGTAAGTVLREPAFPPAHDRYAIRADGGIGALVVRRPSDAEPLADAPNAVVRPPGPGSAAEGPTVRRPDPAPDARGGGSEPRRTGTPVHPRRTPTSAGPSRGVAAQKPGRGTAGQKPGRSTAGQKPGRGTAGQKPSGGVVSREPGGSSPGAVAREPGRVGASGRPGKRAASVRPDRAGTTGEPGPAPGGPPRRAMTAGEQAVSGRSARP
ncbi:hypothetical protein [Actinoplanes sp. CA-252034]|uniref:hypothetical protein n=1 Tax=Actinoplanes sp. CA-252034 TaxID=3239906 RepID=UPI003D965B1C